MRHYPVVLLIFVMVMGVSSVTAADRWNLEFGGGVAVATQDIGDYDPGTGFGLEGKVSYRFQPHLAVYGGWDWHNFTVDQTPDAAEVDIEETGYTVGLEFIHPLGKSSLDYLVRVGATFNHIELENEDGDIVADSDHGVGWEIGSGLAISFNEGWRLTPKVRYRALSRDLNYESTNSSVDLTYIAFDLGVIYSF